MNVNKRAQRLASRHGERRFVFAAAQRVVVQIAVKRKRFGFRIRLRAFVVRLRNVDTFADLVARRSARMCAKRRKQKLSCAKFAAAFSFHSHFHVKFCTAAALFDVLRKFLVRLDRLRGFFVVADRIFFQEIEFDWR